MHLRSSQRAKKPYDQEAVNVGSPGHWVGSWMGSGVDGLKNPTGINGWFLVPRRPMPTDETRTASFANAQALSQILKGTIFAVTTGADDFPDRRWRPGK